MPVMFTGIIEHVGRVCSSRPSAGGRVLEIDVGPLVEDTGLGDSIAMSGVCLTVTAITGSRVAVDVSAETLRKTTLGTWGDGSRVNCERALAVGDRLGGHLVSGHVDGIGRLLDRRAEGDSQRFTFVLPEDGSVKVVEKGSITIDGVSLTTWDCRGARFSVALIPHTLQATTLDGLRPGDRVNCEQDLIGRWVESLLPTR